MNTTTSHSRHSGNNKSGWHNHNSSAHKTAPAVLVMREIPRVVAVPELVIVLVTVTLIVRATVSSSKFIKIGARFLSFKGSPKSTDPRPHSRTHPGGHGRLPAAT